MSRTVASALLTWYDQSARDLPWRGFHDAYRTWISEIMLQQTRVETVIPYYNRFLSLFPTLEALAGASEADVLKAWEGLGYYSRARNLRRGAAQVVAEYGGVLPSDPAELLRITGIGPYTAGAIASIAYDLQVPAVDGNVIRVLSRVFGLRDDLSRPDVRRSLDRLAAEQVPRDRPGDYNQALMDLGATVCVPGTPDCGTCPLRMLCDARAAGDAADLPRLPRAKPPRLIPCQVLLLRSGSSLLFRRRTETLLRGLWVFPLWESDLPLSSSDLRRKLRLSLPEPVFRGNARHVFTHQIWEMKIYSAEVNPGLEAPAGWTLIPAADLPRYPIPTAMKGPLALAGTVWPDLF